MPLPTFSIQESMDYYERQAKNPDLSITRPLFINTVNDLIPGIALDIGCGSFRESSYLATLGGT